MPKKQPSNPSVGLVIQNLPIASLKPADYNPRKIDESQMRALKSSISEYGFIVPVIINKRSGNIVGGHQRVTAASQMGITEIPAVEVDVSAAQEKALNLKLNQVGGWFDDGKLKAVIEDIMEELGTVPDDLGFSDDELAEILSQTEEDLQELSQESQEIAPLSGNNGVYEPIRSGYNRETPNEFGGDDGHEDFPPPIITKPTHAAKVFSLVLEGDEYGRFMRVIHTLRERNGSQLPNGGFVLRLLEDML